MDGAVEPPSSDERIDFRLMRLSCREYSEEVLGLSLDEVNHAMEE